MKFVGDGTITALEVEAFLFVRVDSDRKLRQSDDKVWAFGEDGSAVP